MVSGRPLQAGTGTGYDGRIYFTTVGVNAWLRLSRSGFAFQIALVSFESPVVYATALRQWGTCSVNTISFSCCFSSCLAVWSILGFFCVEVLCICLLWRAGVADHHDKSVEWQPRAKRLGRRTNTWVTKIEEFARSKGRTTGKSLQRATLLCGCCQSLRFHNLSWLNSSGNIVTYAPLP